MLAEGFPRLGRPEPKPNHRVPLRHLRRPHRRLQRHDVEFFFYIQWNPMRQGKDVFIGLIRQVSVVTQDKSASSSDILCVQPRKLFDRENLTGQPR